MKATKWRKVKNSQVENIWKCPNGRCKDYIVNPDWYSRNGTPVCECDEDMQYKETKVKI